MSFPIKKKSKKQVAAIKAKGKGKKKAPPKPPSMASSIGNALMQEPY